MIRRFRWMAVALLALVPAAAPAQTLGPWTPAPPLPPHPQDPPNSVEHYYMNIYACGTCVGLFVGPCNHAVASRVSREGKIAPWVELPSGGLDTRGGDTLVTVGTKIFGWMKWSSVETGSVDPSTGMCSGWKKLTNQSKIAGHTLHAYTGAVGEAANGRKFLFSVGGLNYAGGDHITAKILTNVCWAPIEGGDTWQETTPLPYPAMTPTVVPFHDRLIVIGGGNSTDPCGTNFADINIAVVQPNGGLGPWKKMRPMPYRARGVAAFIAANVLYIVGGIGGDVPNCSPFAEAYAAPIQGDDLGAWVKQPVPPDPPAMYGYATVGPYAIVTGWVRDGKTIPKVYVARLPGAVWPGEKGPEEYAKAADALAKGDYAHAARGFMKVVAMNDLELTPKAQDGLKQIEEAGAKREAEAEALEAGGRAPDALKAYQQVIRDFQGLAVEKAARLKYAALRKSAGASGLPAATVGGSGGDIPEDATFAEFEKASALADRKDPGAFAALERIVAASPDSTYADVAQSKLNLLRSDPAMKPALQAHERGKQAGELRRGIDGFVAQKDVAHAMPVLQKLAADFGDTDAGRWAKGVVDDWSKDPALSSQLSQQQGEDVKKFWGMAENYKKSKMYKKATEYYQKVIDARGGGDDYILQLAKKRLKEIEEETK